MTLHTRRKSSPDWQSISSVWATFPNTLSLLRCNSVSRQNATAWASQSLESLPSVQALFNQSVSLTCKGIISQYTEKLLRGGRQHTYSWHLQSIHKSQRLPRHDQTWSTGGREKKNTLTRKQIPNCLHGVTYCRRLLLKCLRTLEFERSLFCYGAWHWRVLEDSHFQFIGN